MDLWQIAYHLCGITLLGKSGDNTLEPLAELPMPVRNAVLRLAHELMPNAIVIEETSKQFEYVAGDYCWIDHWYCTDQQLKDRILDSVPLPRLEFSSVEEYFTEYALYSNGDTSKDEHYAERLFVKDVFVPLFGLSALTHLQPQTSFGKKGQRIDFVLKSKKNFAIEIQGYTYHGGRDKFNDEMARIRDLDDNGYASYPFTYEDIISGQAIEALKNKVEMDENLKVIVAQSASRYVADTDTNFYQAEALLKGFTERYQQYQLLVLSILWDALRTGKDCITLGDFQPRFPLLAIAMYDTIAVLENVALLYGLPLILPTVEFYVIGTAGSHYQRLLDLYHQSGPQINGQNSDAPTHPISCYVVTTTPIVDFTYYSQAERQRHTAIKGAQPFATIAKYTAPFLVHVGPKLPTNATIANPDRSILDYFARRYFRVPELKHEQLLLLHRALRDEASIGILPTGFGKSLIFQLYAILVPRSTIVISPLKALMRDQLYNLHKLGFKSVEAISSDDSTEEKDAKLKAFLTHKYRLFYISPERLQIKSFQHQLRTAMAKVPIGAFVIDEAHCVSEWGHDFRPAYLQISNFRQQFEEAVGRKVVILGLTATASSTVRQDIVALLELNDEAIIQLSSSDRSNLSFSVHPVADTLTAKVDTLERVLCQIIPQALKIDSWQELIPIGQDSPFPHAGVVFSIYADPHGKTTIEEGAPAIAHRITQRIVPDEPLIRIHASKPTTCCPKCKSVLYLTQWDQNLDCWCQDCDHRFNRNQVYATPKWDQLLIDRQAAFHANQFPLLVATKGFGMGIDKRNIRYVIHHALSSGMEGYFQEAGRAGRDGKHAHIALIYKPPTSACYAEHLSKNQAPPCVTDKQNKQFYKCPYGLDKLCDAGRQARFISDNYPGEAQDRAKLRKVYTDIKLKKGILLAKKDDGADGDESRALQIDLYRLQQLGVVQNYTLEFRGTKQVRFEVDTQPWDLHTLKKKLREFLYKTRSSDSVIDIDITKLLNAAASEVQTSDDQVPTELKVAIDILLKRIYAEIPKMRYTMLGNLLRYVTNDQQRCRRIEIRSIFDGEELPLENYRCGFCDVCQPDLNFQVDMAEVPLRDAEIQHASRQLPQILEVFDVEQLPQLVQVAVGKGAVPGLYAKVSSALERDATNLSTLYLAGALGIRQEQFIDLGFEQLRFCYQEAKRQGLHQAGIRLIYVEAKSIRPIEAFIWINEVNGPFDNQEGLLFLAQEATQLFGTTSHLTHNLHHLHHIRVLQQMQNKITHVSASLSALLEGFSVFTYLKGKN